MKKRLLLYSLVPLVVIACSRPPSAISNTNPFIVLDNTYDYYIREYYTEADPVKGFVLKSKDEATPGKRKLIEVEYLFVSNDGKDNVVYFNTVPDRRQRRYSVNYLGRNQVNMFDVRMMHFGKRIQRRGRELFEFTGFKNSDRDTWEIKRIGNNDSIQIVSIAEVEKNELSQLMVVDSALSTPVAFERVDPFSLVYQSGVKNKGPLAHVSGNKLYYQAKDARQVVIYYDMPISGGSNTQVFGKRRIVYDPDRIFR